MSNDNCKCKKSKVEIVLLSILITGFIVIFILDVIKQCHKFKRHEKMAIPSMEWRRRLPFPPMMLCSREPYNPQYRSPPAFTLSNNAAQAKFIKILTNAHAMPGEVQVNVDNMRIHFDKAIQDDNMADVLLPCEKSIMSCNMASDVQLNNTECCKKMPWISTPRGMCWQLPMDLEQKYPGEEQGVLIKLRINSDDLPSSFGVNPQYELYLSDLDGTSQKLFDPILIEHGNLYRAKLELSEFQTVCARDKPMRKLKEWWKNKLHKWEINGKDTENEEDDGDDHEGKMNKKAWDDAVKFSIETTSDHESCVIHEAGIDCSCTPWMAAWEAEKGANVTLDTPLCINASSLNCVHSFLKNRVKRIRQSLLVSQQEADPEREPGQGPSKWGSRRDVAMEVQHDPCHPQIPCGMKQFYWRADVSKSFFNDATPTFYAEVYVYYGRLIVEVIREKWAYPAMDLVLRICISGATWVALYLLLYYIIQGLKCVFYECFCKEKHTRERCIAPSEGISPPPMYMHGENMPEKFQTTQTD